MAHKKDAKQNQAAQATTPSNTTAPATTTSGTAPATTTRP
jgi:hypothetical protein